MTKNLYIDIHALQTVPSSNINRDDTGSPKTAIYGGVTRSRVSSQSWKRAVRKAFNQENNEEWLKSYRTKKVIFLLAKELKNIDSNLDDDAAISKATEVLAKVKIKPKKDNLTGALLLISEGQLKQVAHYVLENDQWDVKELKKVFTGDQSLDLALFGRMVADDPDLNVEASCQVAHAISTHEVIPEFDFYTALDDIQDEGNTGSAMMGTIDYNSSTLYRYANVNVNELAANLNPDLAIKGASLFIKEFIMTMPNGHENSFANKTLPQYVLVEIRQDTPVNLVSAFEEPIKSRNGYVKESIKRLEKENKKVRKFVEDPILTIALSTEESEIKNQASNIDDLLSKISNCLTKELQDENIND